MGKRLIGLVLLLVVTLPLASCGSVANRRPEPSPSSSPSPSSGVYGIAVVNRGGDISGPSSPSPLPGGFGKSDLVPDGRAVILVKAGAGNAAGSVVARVRADDQGIFRVSLQPGSYIVVGKWAARWWPEFQMPITVHAGEYSRVVLQTGLRY